MFGGESVLPVRSRALASINVAGMKHMRTLACSSSSSSSVTLCRRIRASGLEYILDQERSAELQGNRPITRGPQQTATHTSAVASWLGGSFWAHAGQLHVCPVPPTPDTLAARCGADCEYRVPSQQGADDPQQRSTYQCRAGLRPDQCFQMPLCVAQGGEQDG